MFNYQAGKRCAVSDADRWLAEYGDSHDDISNPVIYWLSVPLVVLATVGILWSLPVPDEFRDISPALNWGSIFLMAAIVYYFIISIALAIGMLPFVFGVAAFQFWLLNSRFSLIDVSVVLLVCSVAGLYLGQHRNGGLLAVLKDLQLMMIGPAWLLSNLYRRLGIPF